MASFRIGLIGDHDEAVAAHRAIPAALRMAAEDLSMALSFDWLATDSMPDAEALARYDALWCVPASPYRDMDGALRAIRHAREHGVPFLGTCGGFQHAVIEYARNVLGWADAEHAETAPDAPRPVIAPLACSLVEVSEVVRLAPGSRIAQAYGHGNRDGQNSRDSRDSRDNRENRESRDSETAREGYHCRYGLNPAFAERLTSGPLRATAFDAGGEVRAVELDGHPFFVCTLFQPERAALRGEAPALVRAFIAAAVAR